MPLARRTNWTLSSGKGGLLTLISVEAISTLMRLLFWELLGIWKQRESEEFQGSSRSNVSPGFACRHLTLSGKTRPLEMAHKLCAP